MCIDNKKSGFTLIELLLVLSLVIAISLLSVPLMIKFFNTSNLADDQFRLKSILQLAKENSYAGYDDLQFGVKISSSSIVMFEGPSYVLRSVPKDIVYSFDGVSIGSSIPNNEVVYSKFSGLPNATGSIIMTVNGETKQIVLNKFGILLDNE